MARKNNLKVEDINNMEMIDNQRKHSHFDNFRWNKHKFEDLSPSYTIEDTIDKTN